MGVVWFCFFFFKQKTAYEIRISDWSSDVCSSDLSDQSERAGQAEMSPQARFPGRWASFQTFGKVGEGSAGMALYGLPRRLIFWKARWPLCIVGTRIHGRHRRQG